MLALANAVLGITMPRKTLDDAVNPLSVNSEQVKSAAVQVAEASHALAEETTEQAAAIEDVGVGGRDRRNSS
jgi:methyl-accepting chemotaxis protein